MPHLPSPCPFLQWGTTAARGRKEGKGSVGETAAWGGWGRPPGGKEEDPPERAAGRRLRTAQTATCWLSSAFSSKLSLRQNAFLVWHILPPLKANLILPRSCKSPGWSPCCGPCHPCSQCFFFWGWGSGGRRGQLKPFLCSKPSGSLRFKALQWSTRPS